MPTKANIKLPPSPANIRIVDENGLPTLYFNRFLIDLMIGLSTVDGNGNSIVDIIHDLSLKVEQNILDITANSTAVATNATDIATNSTDITANTTDIATNSTDIATNTTVITDNTSAITINKTDIATNASAISAVDARVTGYHP